MVFLCVILPVIWRSQLGATSRSGSLGFSEGEERVIHPQWLIDTGSEKVAQPYACPRLDKV